MFTLDTIAVTSIFVQRPKKIEKQSKNSQVNERANERKKKTGVK